MLESTRPHLDAIAALTQSGGRLPSLAAGVVRDGGLSWSTGRGVTVARGERSRPDTNTQYRIGSITKTLTAALVLQLCDRGVVSLKDQIADHVPEGPFPDMTLRDLLAHRAGVPAEPAGPWWERSRGGAYDELARANADVGYVLPTGQQYHYSNTSFAVLARVAEVALSMPWEQAVRERLLEPLGMRRTTYSPKSPHADGYSVDALSGTLTAEPHQDTGAMAPAGQLWSTLDDLAALASLLLGERPDVLSGSALQAMTTPHSASPDDRLAGAYGLGVRIARTSGRVLVGHTGSMPGFLAGVFVDTSTKVGAVLLANGAYGLDIEDLAGRLIATTLEHEPVIASEWEPTEKVPEELKELLGSWYWGNLHCVMSTDGTELRLAPVDGGRTLRFESTDTDTFRGLTGYQTGETLRVVRRGDGSVSHLDIGTFCYTRTPYDQSVDYPGKGDEPVI